MSQCTEVRFASFLSGGFITAIVVNSLERKLANRTSVQCSDFQNNLIDYGTLCARFTTPQLLFPSNLRL